MLPLANRLDETGVFGGFAGKQFATIVVANRDKWVKKGQKVTDKIVEEGSKIVLDTSTMSLDPCRLGDESDDDLDVESGDAQTTVDGEDDEIQSIDWMKVFMLCLIIVLLGVILQLSQLRLHPKTTPKGNPGIWKINCNKLGRAIKPLNICRDGYLRINSDGQATFHQDVSGNCNDDEEKGCFHNAPILTPHDLMKIGLSTLPFDEANVATS